MTALRTWLLGIIGAALLLSLAASLCPKGKYQTVYRLVSGMILLLVMVRPLGQVDLSTLSEVQIDITYRGEETATAQQEALCAVISEKTSAYIQDKAASLGTRCQAEVRCTLRDGVPFPTEVWLDVAYHEPLSQQITTDLAIERDHQHWQEGTS